jgi:predicted esterase
MTYNRDVQDPHANVDIYSVGEPFEHAKVVVVLVHGRGASANSILGLAEHVGSPGVTFLAPDAAGGTWYPHSFLEPLNVNEPFLTSALNCVARVVEMAKARVGTDKVAIGGFSQGGCIALEFALRNPAKYGAIMGLSAGIIGPPGTVWNTHGNLDGTPVFLGCSDVDSHIPLARVHESKHALQRLGADVTERIYPGMAHMINDDEIDYIKGLISNLVKS